MDYTSGDPLRTFTEADFAAYERRFLEPHRHRRTRILLLASSTSLLILLLASAGLLLIANKPDPSPKPTAAISRACSSTRYSSLCRTSLTTFPGATSATSERDLVHVSLSMTLQHITKGLYSVSTLPAQHVDARQRMALDDCVELMDDSASQVSRSLAAVAPGAGRNGTTDDVRTWLSAALTNHDTCVEGLEGTGLREEVVGPVRELSEMVSNALAIFANAAKDNDFDGIPIENRRRRRLMGHGGDRGFPEWVEEKERRMLQASIGSLKVDFIVSKDGNGTHGSITSAVDDAPDNSTARFVIYIRSGRYDENIKVGRWKTNLMFVGDGKSSTIIAGNRSVYDNFTTFGTATFAATATGFIARDITFQNWAGPDKHQAVALRVGADQAVVYRCNIIGYQDTLYVHSQRQFFRECDIYGTVDFVFGNAAVVLQNCSLWARKPLPFQKNTITAQNRKDPNQNTGMSIHASRIFPTPDLAPVISSYPTYLGRPWKLYSRVVFMTSYMADHVDPAGWLEWNATFALDTLYYGEYMNYGPGAAVGKRVTWPGYRVINSSVEAGKFTVQELITGSTWLPSTGVSFLSGLYL